MRTVMGLVFAVAALAFGVSVLLLITNKGVATLLPAMGACFGLLIMVLIGLGAIIEDEIKQTRAVLLAIKDRLPPA